MKKKNKFLLYFLSLVILFVGIYSFNFIYVDVNYPIKYQELISEYSQKYNLDPKFVASVINTESGFNKNAVSSSGAVGLMQIMPNTAEYIADLLNEDFSEDKLFEAETNIKYGCYYLNYLNNKFSDEKVVLCAYNAGETTVSKWLKNKENSNDGIRLSKIPYKGTAIYSDKILNGEKFYFGRI